MLIPHIKSFLSATNRMKRWQNEIQNSFPISIQYLNIIIILLWRELERKFTNSTHKYNNSNRENSFSNFHELYFPLLQWCWAEILSSYSYYFHYLLFTLFIRKNKKNKMEWKSRIFFLILSVFFRIYIYISSVNFRWRKFHLFIFISFQCINNLFGKSFCSSIVFCIHTQALYSEQLYRVQRPNFSLFDYFWCFNKKR